MPGISLVLTDQRMLRNPAQGMAGEAPAQETDTIHFFGQPVALVVAKTFEQARHGAQQLAQQLPADKKVAVNQDDPDAEVETPKKKQKSTGDLEKAMREAAFTVDQNYTTARPCQRRDGAARIGGVVGRRQPDASRQLSDAARFNRAELADSLGIDEDKVRILAPYVGGGFGSKLGIAPEAVAAAIASKNLGVPVAVAMTPPERFRDGAAPLRDQPARPPCRGQRGPADPGSAMKRWYRTSPTSRSPSQSRRPHPSSIAAKTG